MADHLVFIPVIKANGRTFWQDFGGILLSIVDEIGSGLERHGRW
jgi:hypothetical protein